MNIRGAARDLRDFSWPAGVNRPGVGPAFEPGRRERFATGLAELDRLLEGGLPRGRITALEGAASSGRTGLLLSWVARVIGQGEVGAYVDAFDTLDPQFAMHAGVDLRRLVWVRCGASPEKALQAADILVRGGGFGIIALDLVPASGSPGMRRRHIPFQSWVRLQHAVEKTETILAVLEDKSGSGSLAVVTLSLQCLKTRWVPPLEASSGRHRSRLLEGLQSVISMSRGGHAGRVAFHSDY